MIAWFVSNCKTTSRREDYVQSLIETVPVDVFGRCGPYHCHPPQSPKCYQTIAREYRFYLSFENSICLDYLTEKIYNILNYDIIPIVMGGSNYTSFIPDGSFINALDFEDPSQLGQYLIYLAKNPKEYNRYFEWKKYYEPAPYVHYACAICEKLHQRQQKPDKLWNNLESWWFEEGHCTSYQSVLHSSPAVDTSETGGGDEISIPFL